MILLTIIIIFSLFSSSRSFGHQVIQLINQISGGVGPPPQSKSTKHYHNLSSCFHDQFWPDLCHINHYQHISGSAVVIKTQEVKKGTINLVTRVFLREINETGMKSRTEGSMYLLRAINHHDAREDLHAHPHVHHDAGEILLMICCKRKYVED